MSRILTAIIVALIISNALSNELGFLELEEATKSELSINLPDSIIFLTGFNEGFGYFKNLPHQNDCHPDDPQSAQDIIDIIELLRNFTLSESATIIPKILAKASDAYYRISRISDGCHAYSQEFKQVLDDLAVYVSKPVYYTSMTFHFVTHLNTFTSEFKNTIEELRNHDFSKGGQGVGELTRLALFWDFKKN